MRIEQLTFTRFIAAISIVIYHYGNGSNLFNNKYVSFIFEQADIGVSYFYILSGFVMIIAYGNHKYIDFNNYIKNRLARIYPVYVLAIFLILGVNLFSNINAQDLVLNLFMMQSWVPAKALTINIPGWSLSVELFFYLAFPVLLNSIYSKAKFKTLAIWIVSFWLLSQLIFHLIVSRIIELPYYSIQDINYFPLMHFNEFLIGNLTGLFFIKYHNKYRKNFLPEIFVIIFISLFLLKFPVGLNFHNGLFAVLFVPLILLISLSNDRFINSFANKKLIFLGEISFGIYILQAPVWIIFSDYRMNKYLGLNKELDFTVSFLIRFVILILLSAVSYLYFEKPVKNLLTRQRKKVVLIHG